MPDNPQNGGLERRLDAWAASQSGVEPSPGVEKKIRETLAASLQPVRPLPSQGALVAGFMAAFVACALALMALLGKDGFHLMTAAQMACMAAILVGGGVLFSTLLAGRMVPGARRRFSLAWALAGAGSALTGGIALLFPWRMPPAFVAEGWPCAVMELAIAVPAAGMFWLLARRGALFGGAGLGAAVGGLAVFLALTPLQFQCMFQQAPHLLIWHAATAAILIASGALIGALRRGRWPA